MGVITNNQLRLPQAVVKLLLYTRTKENYTENKRNNRLFIEVGIKVFMDGEEYKLEDLPNEYLGGLEQGCEIIILFNDKLE